MRRLATWTLPLLVPMLAGCPVEPAPSEEADESESETFPGPRGPVCGDGHVDAGEACDLGQFNDDQGECTSFCAWAVCGDGLIHQGHEWCDDGNDVPDDACTNDCTLPACGDGILQAGEVCDEGPESTATCDANCTEPVCGDGFVNPAAGEACDDGDRQNTNACLETCEAASCGDGFVWFDHEVCDDGNTEDGDGCSGDCQMVFEHPLCADESVFVLDADSRDPSLGPVEPFTCDRLDAESPSADWQGPGWYRTSDPWSIFAGGPPPEGGCGSEHPAWTASYDVQPFDWDGTMRVCFGSDRECSDFAIVPVISCSEFLLAQLPEVPTCTMRYCTSTIIPP